MRILLFAFLVFNIPFCAFAKVECSHFYHNTFVKRPYSTSTKGTPGFELTKENLKDESHIFEWYIHGLPNNRLDQVLDDYKGLGHRRMNEILRSENPDFKKLSFIDIDVESMIFNQRRALDPNYDPNALEFHRLRLLDNASVLEGQIFPLGYTLKIGTVLYRAVALKKDQIPPVGEIFYDHAFMSTSTKGAVQNFSGDAVGWKNFDQYFQVAFKITNRSFQGKVIPGVGKENEIILPRNVPLRIISVGIKGKEVNIEADLIDSSVM